MGKRPCSCLEQRGRPKGRYRDAITLSIFIDTSMVVRYLMDDPPDMAGQAATVIDGANNLHLTDVVIAETAYVLTSVYRVSRETVVDFLIAFLNKQNISPFQLDKGVVLEALLLCRPSARVSFADAMVWTAALRR